MKISVIARPFREAYLNWMFAAAFRLLALAALVLMPLGMGVSPVQAKAATGHVMASAQGTDHCGDPDGKASGQMMGTHCGGTCNALPGMEPQHDAAPLPTPAVPPEIGVEPLLGLSTVPSTPPPRMK
jgi:hypothetical protein